MKYRSRSFTSGLIGALILLVFLGSPRSSNGDHTIDTTIGERLGTGEMDSLNFLYNATFGSNWIQSYNWDRGGSAREFAGVVESRPLLIQPSPPDGPFRAVPHTGKVTEIVVRSNNLSGTVPNSFISHTSLKVLDLSGNAMRGYVPHDWPQSIETVRLNGNQLAGAIGWNAFRTLPNLKIVDLSNNLLSGEVREELWNLPNTHLSLHDNNLSGKIARNPNLAGSGSISMYGNYFTIGKANAALLNGVFTQTQKTARIEVEAGPPYKIYTSPNIRISVKVSHKEPGIAPLEIVVASSSPYFLVSNAEISSPAPSDEASFFLEDGGYDYFHITPNLTKGYGNYSTTLTILHGGGSTPYPVGYFYGQYAMVRAVDDVTGEPLSGVQIVSPEGYFGGTTTEGGYAQIFVSSQGQHSYFGRSLLLSHMQSPTVTGFLGPQSGTWPEVRLRKMSVAPQGIWAWWFQQFPGVTPSQGSLALDSDGDGLNNLMEYAIGGSPNEPTSLDLKPSSVDGKSTFTITQPAYVVGITYQGETAKTLDGPWTTAGVTRTIVGRQYTFSILESASPKAYLRLKVW